MIPEDKITQTHASSSRLGIWVLILGIVFTGATLRAPLTSVGPIIETIRQDTGMSNTIAGMLTTLPVLAFAFFSPLAPKVARRLGLEYTLFGALLLLAAGIILRSVPFMNTLFIGTVLLGIAIAICNVLLPGLIKREFPNRVGIMTGTYSVSMNMWAAIASGISIPITQGLGFGWRGALACWALLSVVSILFWIPQLRLRQKPKSSPAKGESLWRSSLAWKVALFMGLQSTFFYSVITWLPAILHQQGISQSAAGWLLSLAQFASLPASFIVPILAGRSSNQRSLVGFIVVFLLLGCMGLLSGITALAPLYVILIGIAIGAAFGLATMFFVLRTHNAEQAAELSGMAQSVGYLLAAIAPALFGFIHDIAHAWTIPLIILIIEAVLLFIVGMEAGSNKYVTSLRSNERSQKR
ncbi:MFS transporter [Peribacillus cavernae]|uniref:MFS transporter n=1 Tax=Peribacillus cavernae TaxID=1674310 RepID=A0A3S0UGA5_9BACI|nr:MFS transporter [Peribacillus cavernae]MDQ0218765.1 CP family cyanate transporter-like MFS transporter [Peribacillus cavernae]RUQ30976.1 MFS transporter [Peribacillus cavernae]